MNPRDVLTKLKHLEYVLQEMPGSDFIDISKEYYDVQSSMHIVWQKLFAERAKLVSNKDTVEKLSLELDYRTKVLKAYNAYRTDINTLKDEASYELYKFIGEVYDKMDLRDFCSIPEFFQYYKSDCKQYWKRFGITLNSISSKTKYGISIDMNFDPYEIADSINHMKQFWTADSTKIIQQLIEVQMVNSSKFSNFVIVLTADMKTWGIMNKVSYATDSRSTDLLEVLLEYKRRTGLK